jgi:hypothetical protein
MTMGIEVKTKTNAWHKKYHIKNNVKIVSLKARLPKEDKDRQYQCYFSYAFTKPKQNLK